jgi:hypothetical protein
MASWKGEEHDVQTLLALYERHPNIFFTHLLLTKTKPERHDLQEKDCSLTHPFAERRNESLHATHLLLTI